MEESRHEAEERMAKEIERRVAEEVEKRVTEGVITWVPILITMAVTFVISVIVFKFVWAWVVPDLFPGAVAQDLVSGNLTWLAAVKVAVIGGLLGGAYPAIVKAGKAGKR